MAEACKASFSIVETVDAIDSMHGVHLYKPKTDIGQAATVLAAHEGAPDVAMDVWIEEHLNTVDALHAFYARPTTDHPAELLREMSARLARGEWLDDGLAQPKSNDDLLLYGKVALSQLAGAYNYTAETGMQLLRRQHVDSIVAVINNHEHFAGLELTNEVVDILLAAELDRRLLPLLGQLADEVDVAALVETIVQRDVVQGWQYDELLLCLPIGMSLSDAALLKLLLGNAMAFSAAWQRGVFGAVTNPDTRRLIAHEVGLAQAAKMRLLDALTYDEIAAEITNVRPIVFYNILVNYAKVPALADDTEAIADLVRVAIGKVHGEPRYIRELDVACQKIVLRALGEHHMISANNLRYFTHLGDDECAWLLDEQSSVVIALARQDGASATANALFARVAQATLQRYWQEIVPEVRVWEERREQSEYKNDLRSGQHHTEQEYFDNGGYTVHVYPADTVIAPAEIVARLEREHCVKRLPHIDTQAADMLRDTVINYGIAGCQRSISEHDALAEYILTLDTKLGGQTLYKDVIESLRSRLSFIGEAELAEAVVGIASYWQHLLDSDPNRVLYVHRDRSANWGSAMSSAEYILDRVLGELGGEAMLRYKDRIVLRLDDLGCHPIEHVRAILLDDWVVSGDQMCTQAEWLWTRHPELIDRTEVQLVVASERRIATGLEGGYYHDEEIDLSCHDLPLPVRAYWVAHYAPFMKGERSREVHISGTHSAVDYGFNSLLEVVESPSTALARVDGPYKSQEYRRHNLHYFARVAGVDLRLAEFAAMEGGSDG